MDTIFLADAEQTDRFGALLAKTLEKHRSEILTHGFNIRLEGDLGAGKTATTRAMLRALGVTGRIKSPTFTLLETYPIDEQLEVFHYDFYRFESPEEFIDAGFRDDFAPGHICITEWSEKADPCLPQATLTLALSVNGNARDLTMSADTLIGQRVLKELVDAWN